MLLPPKTGRLEMYSPIVARCTQQVCMCGSFECACDVSASTKNIRSSKSASVDRTPKTSMLDLGRALLRTVQSGTDLRNMDLPIAFLDSRSSLQRGLASLQRAATLERIALIHSQPSEIGERIASVAAFALSGLPREALGKRPFAPVAHEIFRACCQHRNSKTIFITEQVSLQPSVSASLIRNEKLGIEIESFAVPKTKLGGTPPNSIIVDLDGYAIMTVRTNDGGSHSYIIRRPSLGTHGILTIGQPYIAFGGSLTVSLLNDGENHKESSSSLSIQFTAPRFLRNTEARIRSITGHIVIDKKPAGKLKGRWDDIISTDGGKTVWDDVKSWAEDPTPILLPDCKDLELSNERNSLVIWKKASSAIADNNEDMLREELDRVSQKYTRANSKETRTLFDRVEDPNGPRTLR
eukprot:Plantae.Rhodophyta-Hildenbrandia_rubra.ctg35643.p1 GENE.Plantae.Rhodophyta-Hildenbrandia_rubra.ctg35643~~Plantae.Rhodophyta-Hildenbrandia_rubra.ctg35643.p1  ORF type:complete len:409 (-),score=49.58 Plantae.Rhodophyta-Hildenbrandia_rubra.ctg35643:4-1230(-)